MRRPFQLPTPLPGPGSELLQTPQGVIVRGSTRGEWEHPWTITPVWEETEDGKGEWRGYVKPGFVNGRDVYVKMQVGPNDAAGDMWQDVALTDEPGPYLVLAGWRNPLLPQGVSATFDGTIVAGAPDGYPQFFEQLGVKAPAKGGDVTKVGALEAGASEDRNREIRSVDVVLTQPRQGSQLDIRAGNAVADGQTQFVGTVFTNDYVRSSGGRPRLQVMSKFVPVAEDQTLPLLFGALVNAGDAQMDQLLIARIWMVSPPGAGPDDVPDLTWEPVPQYFVHWNLNHATRVIAPREGQPPVQLQTGLLGGLGDALANALLAMVNDGNAEMEAFLGQSDSRGKFWSV